jgi:hypothetical protein
MHTTSALILVFALLSISRPLPSSAASPSLPDAPIRATDAADLPRLAAIQPPTALRGLTPLHRVNGDECPATSHTYCPDQAPQCCYAPKANQYYCAGDLSHCDRE